jgi:SnoaL-like domain
MTTTDAAEVIRRYWGSANARDWDTFRSLLRDDIVYDLPQTRELIRGVERYVEFNATYPGDWQVELARVVGEGRHGASWTDFQVDGVSQTGLCFFDLDEAGLIERITDFWPVPYEPPPGREHLVVRYDPAS